MRIGIVSKFFDFAGVTRVTTRLAEKLLRPGRSVELVYLRGLPRDPPQGVGTRTLLKGRSEAWSVLLGLPVVKILLRDHFMESSSPDFLTWSLAGFLDDWRRRYDLVIYADELFALFNWIYQDITRSPYAVLVHELKSPSQWLARLKQSAMRRSLAVLTPSPIIAEFYSKSFPYRSVLLDLCKPKGGPSHSRDRFCLFDTRWSPFRNPLFALDIMETATYTTFVMTGSFTSASLEDRFRSEVQRRGHGDRLKLVLNPSDEELTKLYSTAGVYARWPETRGPIVTETGIGWGAVMAVENGCPVVVDRRSGAASWLAGCEGAVLSDPSPVAFGRAIEWLLSSDDINSRASSAAWNFSRRHSVDSPSPQLEKVISLTRRRPGPV